MNLTGHLRLRAAARPDGQTYLAEQSFRVPYHLSKTYWDEEAATLVAQIVNPTAGILEGDALESHVAVGAGASLLVTTPSASRVFRMADGSAVCRQHFEVAAGGWLELLPEPLVPHRGSRYRQHTTVALEPGAGLLFVDQLWPGRVGHGEAWAWTELLLDTEIRLAGECVLRERFAHGGGDLEALSRLAGTGPHACFGNAVVMGESGGQWVEEAHALQADGVWIGASPLRRGGWSVKFVASDSIRLRATVTALRAILAREFPRAACAVRKY